MSLLLALEPLSPRTASAAILELSDAFTNVAAVAGDASGAMREQQDRMATGATNLVALLRPMTGSGNAANKAFLDEEDEVSFIQLVAIDALDGITEKGDLLADTAAVAAAASSAVRDAENLGSTAAAVAITASEAMRDDADQMAADSAAQIAGSADVRDEDRVVADVAALIAAMVDAVERDDLFENSVHVEGTVTPPPPPPPPAPAVEPLGMGFAKDEALARRRRNEARARETRIRRQNEAALLVLMQVAEEEGMIA